MELPDIDIQKHVVSIAAVSSTIATMTNVLPFIVGLVGGILAIVWYSLQIWESDALQRFVHSRRLRHMAKLKIAMAKLEAQELLLHPVDEP